MTSPLAPGPVYQAWQQAATPDVFGPIKGAGTVRQALQATIDLWSATYIAEVSAAVAVPMEPFEHWDQLYTDRALPADLTATCWTTCFTTDPKTLPTRQGDGTWRARWLAQANLVVNGENWDTAADLMGWYMAAVRTLILQHRSLGGVVIDTVWIGEAMRPGQTSAARTVQTGVIQFAVTVDRMAVDSLGPAAVDTNPGDPGNPTVDQVSATLIKEPVE